MDNCVIAKYIRLSMDEAMTDSQSIESQRMMLDRFIAEKMSAEDATVLEFVDNGFSGTNFERPGVQELLELIQAGKVHCVLVKDFSRFGRNAIETGYFIERVFPLYSVRFISLDDCFDSAEYGGDTGGLEVSFKFLIHELYSKDLSRKITSVKRDKIRRGEALTKNCVFGYMLDSRRKMVIDPAAADTVRLIFNMYAKNKSLADIEKRLYEESRLSPASYKKQKRMTAQDAQFTCVWQKSVILKILKDEQYAGVYVGGKTEAADTISYGRVKTAEEDWVRIPGHHPAIIPQPLFDRVQENLRVKGEPMRKRDLQTSARYSAHCSSPLKGKVICAHCGHTMRLSSTKNAAFHCWFTRSAPDILCHKLRVSKAEIENALFTMISRQAELILNVGSMADVAVQKPGFEKDTEYSARIHKVHEEKRTLFEQYVSGEIDVDRFRSGKALCDSELCRLEQTRTAFMAHKEALAANTAVREVAKTVTDTNGLSQELVDLLIDKVLVYPDNHLEIFWKIAAFGENGSEVA